MNNMCCIDMKLVIQIVLCSATVGLAMKCGNNGSDTLCNCRNNPHIRIEKDTASYKLSLISGLPEVSNWINCSSLCNICALLTIPTSNNCPNMPVCEDQVDAFLNSFCASVTPTTHTSTVTNTQTITSNSTFPVTITSLMPTMIETITTGTTTSTTTKTIHTQQVSITALGLLLGILVIVLTAVIIGWVWTCWTIERRERMGISSKNMTVVTNTNEEERYFKNPIHEDTSSEENSTRSSVNNEALQNPNFSATMYNTIDKNKEDGPAYDVLSTEKSTDHRQGQVVSNLQESEDYSRLGLCNKDIERNYQLIDNENLGLEDKT